jgi:hypothetical protein
MLDVIGDQRHEVVGHLEVGKMGRGQLDIARARDALRKPLAGLRGVATSWRPAMSSVGAVMRSTASRRSASRFAAQQLT